MEAPCVAGARVWQALVCGRRSCVAGARVWQAPVCVHGTRVCVWYPCVWHPCTSGARVGGVGSLTCLIGISAVAHAVNSSKSTIPPTRGGGVHSGAGAEWTAVSDAAVSDAAVSDAARVP